MAAQNTLFRPQRSILAVPATSDHFFASATASGADSVFLDLEDSVAPSRKDEAREMAIAALVALDWGTKRMTVRINEFSSMWGYRDVIALIEQAPRLDSLLIPKVETAEDIRFIERLVLAVETACGRDRPVTLEALIENPSGVTEVEAIASASTRLTSLTFGVGDYSLAMQVPQMDYGTPDPDYAVLTVADPSGARSVHANDQWHFALARIANACRANGIRPLDGPFTAISDLAGFRAAAGRARALGYEGKWAIHPGQIETANAVFSPTPAELAWAARVDAAMQDALAAGAGAAQLDGQMIDLAHVRHARLVRDRKCIIEEAQ